MIWPITADVKYQKSQSERHSNACSQHLTRENAWFSRVTHGIDNDIPRMSLKHMFVPVQPRGRKESLCFRL